MKTRLLNFITALALSAGIIRAAPLGTAFTYQGKLVEGIDPANGSYDLKFTLYDASADGSAVGGPLTNSAVSVSNGLFITTLDFGVSAFIDQARWLEIAVRPAGGGAFALLTPRQPLTAAPYALWASSAAFAQTATVAKDLAGPLAGDKLVGTYSSKLNLTNVTNVFFGELYGDVYGGIYGDHYGDSFGDFYGDGCGIKHLNASQLAFGTLPDARLSTNVAVLTANQTFSGSNVFTGALIATNTANAIQGTFTGNAAGLTNLNGVALSFGTVGNSALQTGALTADKLAPGQVVRSLNNLKDDVVLAAGENIILTTNGNSLQVSASSVATAWRLAGNPATVPGTDFVGTTDNQALELKVNNQRGLRLEPTADTDTVNVIGGSARNFVGAGVVGVTIGGGGTGNYYGAAFTNGVDANFGTVSGGFRNTIGAYADYSTIGGGWNSRIQFSSSGSTIAGGANNTIQLSAGGATIGGGNNNTIQDNGLLATIPGGRQNSATNFAFAAGTRAKANHQGTFVWGDSFDGDVASSAVNQFTVRASGGARFFSNTDLSAGVSLAASGTAWASISDRNVKKNLQPVDSREVLERLAVLSISRWNYQWEPDAAVPHIGPMAQDFKAAFFPGRDDKSITTLEADGVELAAIQGLNQKVEAQRAENAELKQEVAELKRLVNEISARLNGGKK